MKIIRRSVSACALLLCLSPVQAMRSMEFLEQYRLDELSYVGMSVDKCGSSKTTYAIFQDLEGFTHRAKVGNYIGFNFGVLVKISENSVKLMEVVQGASGEWTERETLMPRTERKGTRERFGYEQEQAMAKGDSSARALRHKLVMCGELYFQDRDRRLTCFEDAIKVP